MTFSEQVYATSSGGGALQVSDFVFALSGGSATLTSVTPDTISGSGKIVTLGIALTGLPNGSETLTVNPKQNAVYDGSGNVASTTQSNNTAQLTDKAVTNIT